MSKVPAREEMITAPWQVDDGAKVYTDGTHRVICPTATIEKISGLFRQFGITRVANITGLDKIGIPVAIVCRPNSKSLAVSQGKGLSWDSARASALMESVESYHAENIRAPLRFAAYDDIRSFLSVVDVTELPSITRSVFHERLRLLWIEGVDILTNGAIWVPYEIVSTDCTLPYPPGSNCFQATSNGLASGNHLWEAISHGICEVVERDAAALWKQHARHNINLGRIDRDTIDDPSCCDLLRRCDRASVSITIWEQTSDLGIPVFRCLIMDNDENIFHSSYVSDGYGCHPNSRIALLRAITEAAQSRLTLISGTRDNILPHDYQRLRDNEWVAQLRRELVSPCKDLKSFSEVPSFSGKTLRDDVSWLCERLRLGGLRQVIVVNLTDPTFNIPVVRIIIPGLEGVVSAAGYKQGRRANRLSGFLK